MSKGKVTRASRAEGRRWYLVLGSMCSGRRARVDDAERRAPTPRPQQSTAPATSAQIVWCLAAATATMRSEVSTRPARAVRDWLPVTGRPIPAQAASPHVYNSPQAVEAVVEAVVGEVAAADV